MFVIARKAGQLGNRLVHMSHVAAAALERGQRVANPCLDEYAGLFEATAGDPWCRFPPGPPGPPAARWRRWAAVRLAGLGLRLARRLPLPRRWADAIVWRDLDRDLPLDGPDFAARADRAGLLFLEGWRLRSPRIADHAGRLRAFFTPARVHRERIDALLAALRPGCDLLVGVHVRRGDYARHLGGRYYWAQDAYAALMRRAAALHPGRRVRFLVCSNEPLDAAAFPGLDVGFGTGHLVEDLYAFARCDLLVGPPSTFTGWASFHGQVPLRAVESPDDPLRLEDFAVYAL